MAPCLDEYLTVAMMLKIITMNKHYHILLLEKEKKGYLHYSSVTSPVHDRATNEMVTSKFFMDSPTNWN